MPIPRIRFTIRRLMLLALVAAALLGAFEAYRRRQRERLLATQRLLLLITYHAQTQDLAVRLSPEPPEPSPVLPPPSTWFMADDQAEPPAPK